ncbi:hypothetical protein ACVI1L_003706 [Bradyrhizobium sp. USDA 4516]
MLAANATKSAREQLTLIRIFEELRGRGFDGGYDAMRRYARQWSKERGQSTARAYVPLSFASGEAYRFDWSHEVVLLSGTTVIVKVAHVRLCHSRMLLARAYQRDWTPLRGQFASRLTETWGRWENARKNHPAVTTEFIRPISPVAPLR